MKTRYSFFTLTALIIGTALIASCGIVEDINLRQDVVDAAMELKDVIPGIQAGLALAVPDDPISRALTPSDIVPSDWPHGTDTPAEVYATEGGVSPATIRLPASGYYSMTNGNEVYLTLTPETALGTTYYRVILYTYPAVDLAVAYTVEEYIVNSAGTEDWPWANLDLDKNTNSWISLETIYTDGTKGTRTVVWNSITADPVSYYSAFTAPDPVPGTTTSFDGYRYEDKDTAPTEVSTGMLYSSHVTEDAKGKGTKISAIQYYTESDTVYSGLTYLLVDYNRKSLTDVNVVTRMVEDTTADTKTIRSVGEIGTSQYYIAKVDISLDTGGKIVYTSSHEVYDTILPRAVDANANSGTAIDLTEDSAGAGTFTGTLETARGTSKTVRDITITRGKNFRFEVKFKYKEKKSRALADEFEIALTRQDLSNLIIDVPTVNGTFAGYYEGGSLFGTISAADKDYHVAITDEGVEVDDKLYEYK